MSVLAGIGLILGLLVFYIMTAGLVLIWGADQGFEEYQPYHFQMFKWVIIKHIGWAYVWLLLLLAACCWSSYYYGRWLFTGDGGGYRPENAIELMSAWKL